MSDDTMRLWKQFERTDPGHTKPVEFGRKFTSIDAHWQIKRVTEVLGPVGEGWSYRVQHSTIELNPRLTLCFADVTILWGTRRADGQFYNSYGPVRGCCELYAQRTYKRKLEWHDEDKTVPVMELDDDAPKKAMTDALTKALSHLGVSADVFLGLFDDSKYVDKMRRHFEAQKASENLPAAVTIALEQVAGATTIEALETSVKNARAAAADWTTVHRNLYAIRVNEKRLKLGAPVPAAE